MVRSSDTGSLLFFDVGTVGKVCARGAGDETILRGTGADSAATTGFCGVLATEEVVTAGSAAPGWLREGALIERFAAGDCSRVGAVLL